MCFPTDSWVSTADISASWEIQELKVRAEVHTLQVNEMQLTLPLPPWGLLDAKGVLQGFSHYMRRGAKGFHSSGFKRGTAERESASHLYRGAPFKQLFFSIYCIFSDQETQLHCLSFIILTDDRLGRWHQYHRNLAERHVTCQQHLLPLIPPSAVVLPLQPNWSSSVVVCMHWIQEGFTMFKTIDKLSVTSICMKCLQNMKRS